jgi:uncharacterized repeat protein (TIGR03803 family)
MSTLSWRTICLVCVFCGLEAIGSPAQTFKTLVSFNGTDGQFPLYEYLVQGLDGNFYGTTEYGGDLTCEAPLGCGTVFKITPAGMLTTLYSFCAKTGCSDGILPVAGLVQATNGNFYGTTPEWRGQQLWHGLRNHHGGQPNHALQLLLKNGLH